jgi:hypothetical protein
MSSLIHAKLNLMLMKHYLQMCWRSWCGSPRLPRTVHNSCFQQIYSSGGIDNDGKGCSYERRIESENRRGCNLIIAESDSLETIEACTGNESWFVVN